MDRSRLLTVTAIRIVEVGPRDGLQNESARLPLADKVRFIDALSKTGLREIEAGAFVRPDRVPQMADSESVLRRIRRARGVVYSALVPNEQGFERAVDAGADKAAVFTAASETFNRRNINASIRESIDRFRPVVARARRMRLPLRAYVSTAFWCPYEGKVSPAAVARVARTLLELGVQELSIGDTIGKASPSDVRRLLDALLKTTPAKTIFLHFHDTYGMAVANALCAWSEYRITGFDASAGGLGGCPYAPGASGNVATEDLLYALKASGADVPAEPKAVAAAAALILARLGREPSSRLGRLARGAAGR
ncbi:MAG: hydroxymethylglutaryl-CoA lyase [Elusimicrobia bacterium]|nr:hydroxymethylglutaryl-CoA lyase [Elusimicrobiota bacterium]